MPEGVRGSDGSLQAGAATDDDAQAKAWAAAMAAPEPAAPTVAAPPKKVDDPEAPYGRTADGKPKKGPGGRPPKAKAEDKPRVDNVPAPVAPGSARDYRAGLGEVAQSVWGTLAMFPPTRPQATIFKINSGGLIHAFNLGAQQNEKIRAGVEWLVAEAWIMALVGACAPFALQTFFLWTAPDRLPMSKDELAAQCVADLLELAKQDEEAMRAAAAAPMQAAA